MGVQDGFIALWRDGTPEPAKVFPYRAFMLPEADRRALENGIRIESDEELAQFLEDYLS